MNDADVKFIAELADSVVSAIDRLTESNVLAISRADMLLRRIVNLERRIKTVERLIVGEHDNE